MSAVGVRASHQPLGGARTGPFRRAPAGSHDAAHDTTRVASARQPSQPLARSPALVSQALSLANFTNPVVLLVVIATVAFALIAIITRISEDAYGAWMRSNSR